ncbi:hypothetical protein VTN31DRAFT_120 [Thermomyces dupontii]|uniref:uncharacterized protein n=1 Tax=Talaromyces thermophilus TaxID=28565 RepID=UPI0037430F87
MRITSASPDSEAKRSALENQVRSLADVTVPQLPQSLSPHCCMNAAPFFKECPFLADQGMRIKTPSHTSSDHIYLPTPYRSRYSQSTLAQGQSEQQGGARWADEQQRRTSYCSVSSTIPVCPHQKGEFNGCGGMSFSNLQDQNSQSLEILLGYKQYSSRAQ